MSALGEEVDWLLSAAPLAAWRVVGRCRVYWYWASCGSVRSRRNTGLVVLSRRLEFVARDLQSPQGRMVGRAVLNAIGAGLDDYEAHLSEIADLSGLSEAELREIVTEAREVQRPDASRVRRQHLVSQVLLRQWFTQEHPTNVETLFFATGETELRNPESVAYVANYVKIDSRRIEQLWNTVEDKLPDALAAAKSDEIFRNTEAVRTIRDAIALHYARSFDVLQTHTDLWNNVYDVWVDRFASEPEAVEAWFKEKHGGIYPPNPRAAAEE